MAQLDPSIALQVQQPDILGAIGKATTLKHMLGQQRAQEMQLQQAEEDRAATMRLNDLYRSAVGQDGQVDRSKLSTGLAGAGMGSKLPGLQKQWADADKAAADVKNTNSQIGERDFGVAKKKLEATGAVLQSLLANPQAGPQDALNGIQSLVNAGIMTPEEGAAAYREIPTGNPQQFRNYLVQKGLQVLDASKRIDVLTPKLEQVNLGGSTQLIDTNSFTRQPGAPTSFQRTMTPGEIAQDQRSRERLAFDKEQGANQFIPVDGVGLFVGDKRTGTVRPVTDPSGAQVKPEKEPSEGERKAGTLLSRLSFSQGQLKKTLESAPDAAKPGILAEAVRALPVLGGDTPANLITPSERQQVEAAQLDILDAALTLGTGAAYTKEQLRGYAKSYFPQIGDDTATVEDKAARLNNVIEAAKIAAGRAASKVPQQPGAAPIKVASDADYAKVPKGARYQAPDGSIRVKQ